MIIIAILLTLVGIAVSCAVFRASRRHWPRGEHPKFFRQP